MQTCAGFHFEARDRGSALLAELPAGIGVRAGGRPGHAVVHRETVLMIRSPGVNRVGRIATAGCLSRPWRVSNADPCRSPADTHRRKCTWRCGLLRRRPVMVRSPALLSRPRPVVGCPPARTLGQIRAQGQRLKNVPPFFLPVRVLPPSTSLNSQTSLTWFAFSSIAVA